MKSNVSATKARNVKMISKSRPIPATKAGGKGMVPMKTSKKGGC